MTTSETLAEITCQKKQTVLNQIICLSLNDGGFGVSPRQSAVPVVGPIGLQVPNDVRPGAWAWDARWDGGEHFHTVDNQRRGRKNGVHK